MMSTPVVPSAELRRLVEQLSARAIESHYSSTVDRARRIAGAIDLALVDDRALDLAFGGLQLTLTTALTRDFEFRFASGSDLIAPGDWPRVSEHFRALVRALETDLTIAADLAADLDGDRALRLTRAVVRFDCLPLSLHQDAGLGDARELSEALSAERHRLVGAGQPLADAEEPALNTPIRLLLVELFDRVGAVIYVLLHVAVGPSEAEPSVDPGETSP